MAPALCILDANIIIGDRRLRRADSVAFLKAVARGDVDSAVPWVAFEETINNFRESAAAEARALRDACKELARLGIQLDAELESGKEADAYRQWLAGVLDKHGISTLALPVAPHETLVMWDIASRKPFKPGGKGYRDALIWHSVIDAARDRVVYFVTDNASDFAVGRRSKDQLAPELLTDLEKAGVSPQNVKLVPSLADLLEIVSGDAPDVVAALNHAFDSGRPVLASLTPLLEAAAAESPTYNIEVEDAPGEVVEILQEVMHSPAVKVERATVTEDNTYLIQMYVEADIDVHLTWTKPDSEFEGFGIGHYESEGTTATLWYSVTATYDRDENTFSDVAVYGSAHGTVNVRW